MNKKATVLSAIFLLTFVGISLAQGDFFWSFNDLNSGATNADANGSFAVGTSGTLFLYYTTHGPHQRELDTGAFLDISTTTAGIIDFTAAETFEYDITIGPDNIDIGNRWGDSFGSGFVSDDSQQVDLSAFTVINGDGMINQNTGPVILDQGYDAAADAFLFGSVDFNVVGSGSTGFQIHSGSGGICHACDQLNHVFGNVTISGIPEPTTSFVLALVFCAMAVRQRKRAWTQ